MPPQFVYNLLQKKNNHKHQELFCPKWKGLAKSIHHKRRARTLEKPCVQTHVLGSAHACAQLAQSPLHNTQPGKKLVSPAVFYCAESRLQIGEKHTSNLQTLYCTWTSKTHTICWKYMHQIHQLNSWFPNSTVKTVLAWNVWTKAIQLETSHLPRSHTWLTFIFVSSFVG